MAEIRIDWGAVDRMLRSPTGMVGRDLRRRADRAAASARRDAPGSMPSQIAGPAIGRRGGELSATITSRHPATVYVVNGTVPHIIRPVSRKALRFNVGGRTVFAKVVNHPGTRPNDFLTKALRTAI
ncbi:hypothetical protein [Streptomyces iconiensis]|uniref:HK97 gp10 family phage protein n=1 Tax=Streptomyces iconiensis TaxID=1384038 RepID=A0ABT7A998_9ACTN|nr:hypothetical protein [Streptomyces iconiensis]MDJ1137926.1 hypothetical protein [Streptomyces iconiensis]